MGGIDIRLFDPVLSLAIKMSVGVGPVNVLSTIVACTVRDPFSMEVNELREGLETRSLIRGSVFNEWHLVTSSSEVREDYTSFSPGSG